VRLTARTDLATAALAVGDALRRRGIHAVLTGGACANLHSGGTFVSADIDFILSGRVARRELDAAMAGVGFARRGDRYVHPRLGFFVEFPRGPLAIGEDFRIRPIMRSARRLRALILSPTDACRDRLAAFYHWNDRQGLEAAVQIALRNPVKLAVVRRWSAGEGFADRFEEFRDELKRSRAVKRPGRGPGRTRPLRR